MCSDQEEEVEKKEQPRFRYYIAFAGGGAHLPIAHALRLLYSKELRFGLTKLNLRKNNFLKYFFWGGGSLTPFFLRESSS